jgi:hypothetical protein
MFPIEFQSPRTILDLSNGAVQNKVEKQQISSAGIRLKSGDLDTINFSRTISASKELGSGIYGSAVCTGSA